MIEINPPQLIVFLNVLVAEDYIITHGNENII